MAPNAPSQQTDCRRRQIAAPDLHYSSRLRSAFLVNFLAPIFALSSAFSAVSLLPSI
jgi:hypothetical protein